MKTILGIQVPESVDDILHGNEEWSNEFYSWSAHNSEDFINYPERAERCVEAAKNSSDGSTHAERIEDFREYGKDLFRRLRKQIDDDDVDEEVDQCEEAYEKDCDELAAWHEANGSLDEECG